QDHTVKPELHGKTDLGPYFYAAQTLHDAKGRRLMWGWVKEGRSEQAQRSAGWAGVMSLPRLLSRRSDGTLGMAPVPELAGLRGRHQHWADVSLSTLSEA